ncbi:MAG: DUF2892 domain-containing protein [Endomicrobiales bacterium]|nr:DUF2892 domain-containing protein [Endomicrobiales bacterium]
MKKNVGGTDRIIRLVLGAALIAAGIVLKGVLGLVLIIAGVIGIVTGLIGWCGLYTVLGINTCKISQ